MSKKQRRDTAPPWFMPDFSDAANTPRTIAQLSTFLRDHLLTHILPFWTAHAIDPDGGISSCIKDDGTIASRDKWMWSQWRALWVFSKLFNDFGHDSEHLRIATHIYEFVRKHAFDPATGGVLLVVDHTGRPVDGRGCESIYSDAFAISALAEFAKASRRQEPIELARRSCEHVLKTLREPHEQIPHFPYPVPAGARVHGIPMIFSLSLWEVGRALGVPRYCDAALDLSSEIFSRFYRREFDLIVERVAVDGSLFPGPLGTAVNPGHVIEDMWFQIHIARESGHASRIGEYVRLIRRHLEVGWDNEFGGLFLAVDARGGSEIGWPHAETKLWWPHTEAMYATLLAYEYSKEQWCLDWYQRLHEYSFAHFPVATGEWRQKLDRKGEPMTTVVALPVKDPFHLPRALIYCVESLGRLGAGGRM